MAVYQGQEQVERVVSLACRQPEPATRCFMTRLDVTFAVQNFHKRRMPVPAASIHDGAPCIEVVIVNHGNRLPRQLDGRRQVITISRFDLGVGSCKL